MPRRLLAIVSISVLPLLGTGQSIFSDFDNFLKANVVFGLVDYEFLSNNQGKLEGISESIASYELSNSTTEEQTAFYINAYNFLVINQIARNYPIKSPLEVDGFFKENTFLVAGETLTLDEIEFTKLLGKTKDPKIHFALGCGARGCPFLYDEAFFPERINEQLDFRARQIIEISNYVFMDEDKQVVIMSKIFDWYTDQFLAESESLIEFVNQYRSRQIPSNYRVQFREYDWSLNDR